MPGLIEVLFGQVDHLSVLGRAVDGGQILAPPLADDNDFFRPWRAPRSWQALCVETRKVQLSGGHALRFFAEPAFEAQQTIARIEAAVAHFGPKAAQQAGRRKADGLARRR